MVVTDNDLVFKLLSLPSEARRELLSVLGESSQSEDGDRSAAGWTRRARSSLERWSTREE